MSESSKILRRIFMAYEEGNSPRGQQAHLTDSNGSTTLVCSQSGRGDMVVAAHITDDLFAAVRVDSALESKGQRVVRVATSVPDGSADWSRKFKGCRYQFLTFRSPDVRSGGGATAVHRACHWNQADTTRTSNFARQLVRDWEQYVQSREAGAT